METKNTSEDLKFLGEFKVYEDPNPRMPVLLNWPTPDIVIGSAIVNVKGKD